MGKKIDLGGPGIGKKWVQDIKIDKFTNRIGFLMPHKNGMSWFVMTCEGAESLGVINTDALEKIMNDHYLDENF